MRHKPVHYAVLVCCLPVIAACGPKGTTDSASTSASETSSQPIVTTDSSPTTTAAPTQGAAGVNFTMPNEVGKVLQDAQNDLHSYGVFYSKSHDMLGSRHQVLDRDWKICNQNVPAGQQVSGNAEGIVDFGVVKLSESCP